MFSATRESQSYITRSLHVFHSIVSALMQGDVGQLHAAVSWTKVCALIHPKQHIDSNTRKKKKQRNVCPNLFGSNRGGKKQNKRQQKEEKKQKGKHSLTVDPEEALSTRIGAVKYFIAGTVFRLTEALMRNNWKSKASDRRQGTSRNREASVGIKTPEFFPTAASAPADRGGQFSRAK